MQIPKHKPIRSKKITKSAEGEPCTTRIPGACNFNRETTVFCHAPSGTKGMGVKSDDFWGAYCCSGCHAFLDGKAISPYVDSSGKDRYWNQGINETQRRLIDKGLVVIK